MGTPYTKLWIRVLREKQDLAIHSRSSLTSGNEGVCSDQGITPSLLSWVSSGHTIGIPGNDWLTGGGVTVSCRVPANGQESLGVPGSRGTISLKTPLSTSKIYSHAHESACPSPLRDPSEKPVFNTQHPQATLLPPSAW